MNKPSTDREEAIGTLLGSLLTCTVATWVLYSMNSPISRTNGTPVGSVKSAWHSLNVAARREWGWQLTIVTERTAEGTEKILCIKGMGNFPDTVEKVSIHPTNTGAYEITANARKLKPDDQAQPILTKNQDYILLKDPQWEEIAKWHVSRNVLELKRLSVSGILTASQECEKK